MVWRSEPASPFSHDTERKNWWYRALRVCQNGLGGPGFDGTVSVVPCCCDGGAVVRLVNHK
jgi:hypothetical protein